MKNKKFKFISLLLSTVLVLALFSGCGNEQNEELTKVRLNEVVRSIFYAPMYVAINEGFFEEEGIDIELSTGQGADGEVVKTQVL